MLECGVWPTACMLPIPHAPETSAMPMRVYNLA